MSFTAHTVVAAPQQAESRSPFGSTTPVEQPLLEVGQAAGPLVRLAAHEAAAIAAYSVSTTVRRGGGRGGRASSAACIACQASDAHFTRIGNRETPRERDQLAELLRA